MKDLGRENQKKQTVTRKKHGDILLNISMLTRSDSPSKAPVAHKDFVSSVLVGHKSFRSHNDKDGTVGLTILYKVLASCLLSSGDFESDMYCEFPDAFSPFS